MKPGKPVAVVSYTPPQRTSPSLLFRESCVCPDGILPVRETLFVSKMDVPNPELPTMNVELGQDFTKREVDRVCAHLVQTRWRFCQSLSNR